MSPRRQHEMADLVSNHMAENQGVDRLTIKHRRGFVKYAVAHSALQQTPALLFDSIRQYVCSANSLAVVTKCKSVNVRVIAIEERFVGGRDKDYGKLQAICSIPNHMDSSIPENADNVFF